MSVADEAVETLRNAAFPVWAIPPSQWPGNVLVGGVWGSSAHPLSITLRYGDDFVEERPSRQMEIVSTGTEGLEHRSPRDRELAWEFSYANQIINFTHTFTELEERPVPGSERFNADLVDGKMIPKVVRLESAGPRRLDEPLPFSEGHMVEPVTFEHHPALRCYRIRMPGVEVFIMSWSYEDAFVSESVLKLRPITDDPELFAEVERAAHAAWERIRQRKGWENE